MQRNANMLKILKKVRFCRFYWFLCKNAVPSLSPRTNFCPSIKLCNTLYNRYLQGCKWALKKNILHRKVRNSNIGALECSYVAYMVVHIQPFSLHIIRERYSEDILHLFLWPLYIYLTGKTTD